MANNKIAKTLLKVFVSLFLFWFLYYTGKLDLTLVIKALNTFKPFYAALVIVFLVLNYVISSFRWHVLILEGADKVKVTELIRYYFIGSFFNNFMPTSIGGDVYKIHKLNKKIGNMPHAFSATFMERFTGVLVLVLLAYIGLLGSSSTVFDLIHPKYQLIVKLMFYVGFWVCLVGGFFVLKFAASRHSKLAEFYSIMRVYFTKKSILFYAFVTSLIVQLLGIFTQFFIFKGLGVNLNVLYSLLVFPIITLASFFIPSLNGLGVQDLLYERLFIGVTLAITASLLYHFFRLLVSLIGGILYAFEKN
ncbi:MAG: lysylphosphatidylglycerol synthase transmembrane domain-containing protein [Patescibacteria group bacterium]